MVSPVFALPTDDLKQFFFFEKGVKMNNNFHFLKLFFNVFGVFSSLDRFESGTKSEKDIQIMMSLHIIM